MKQRHESQAAVVHPASDDRCDVGQCETCKRFVSVVTLIWHGNTGDECLTCYSERRMRERLLVTREDEP